MRIRLFCLAAVVVAVAGSVLSGETGIPNRLAVAQPGEWARYTMPNGYIQKQTVLSREGDGPTAQVVVRIENIFDDEVITVDEITREAGAPGRPAGLPDSWEADIEIKRTEMNIMGKRIPVTILEIEFEDEDDDDEVEWYISEEIPVFGIIKQIKDDNVEYELLDYGNE